MATIEEQATSEIVKKYKAYCAEIFESYEDFCFQEFYLPLIHKKIKTNDLPIMDFEVLHSNAKYPFMKNKLYGVISRQERRIIGERTLLAAVSATENFLQKIVFRIYRDFEHKLETTNEAIEQQAKILKIIIDSSDKQEIINRISEEKIRGIFYGNPVDFFKKDKARIGYGKYFADNYEKALNQYAEIIARRNIIIHNNGKVDRKYLREIPDTTFRLSEKIKIDKQYLKETIILLHGISTVVMQQAILINYKKNIKREKVKDYIKFFETKYKGK